MLEDKDYIMRIVHEWIRTLIKLIFNKDIDKDDEEPVSLEVIEQYKKLLSMIDDGEINEAENILIDGLKEGDRAYFEMALLFYEKLSGKTDEFLPGSACKSEKKYIAGYVYQARLLPAVIRSGKV